MTAEFTGDSVEAALVVNEEPLPGCLQLSPDAGTSSCAAACSAFLAYLRSDNGLSNTCALHSALRSVSALLRPTSCATGRSMVGDGPGQCCRSIPWWQPFIVVIAAS